VALIRGTSPSVREASSKVALEPSLTVGLMPRRDCVQSNYS